MDQRTVQFSTDCSIVCSRIEHFCAIFNSNAYPIGQSGTGSRFKATDFSNIILSLFTIQTGLLAHPSNWWHKKRISKKYVEFSKLVPKKPTFKAKQICISNLINQLSSIVSLFLRKNPHFKQIIFQQKDIESITTKSNVNFWTFSQHLWNIIRRRNPDFTNLFIPIHKIGVVF